MLVNELQHRARNLLTIVRSLADRTMRQGGSVEAFEVRLQALGRAQGLLRQSGSDRVEVGALVRAELAAHGDSGSQRATVSGPQVFSTARQVQNFALALHELATNALKYGALGDGAGHLRVTWEVPARVPPPGAQLAGERRRHWDGSGDATRLRHGAHPGCAGLALGAEVEYVLGADGVRCRIEMPVS